MAKLNYRYKCNKCKQTHESIWKFDFCVLCESKDIIVEDISNQNKQSIKEE